MDIRRFKPSYRHSTNMEETREDGWYVLHSDARQLIAALNALMPMLEECDCIHSDRPIPLCPCKQARRVLHLFDDDRWRRTQGED